MAQRLGISEVLCRKRLKWFGHVKRMDTGNPASACRYVEVESKKKVRQKKHGFNQKAMSLEK